LLICHYYRQIEVVDALVTDILDDATKTWSLLINYSSENCTTADDLFPLKLWASASDVSLRLSNGVFSALS
jgi:hypothetical protein